MEPEVSAAKGLVDLAFRADAPGDGITRVEAERLAAAGMLPRDIRGVPYGYNHRKEAMLDLLTKICFKELLGPWGRITIVDMDEDGPTCRIEVPGMPAWTRRMKSWTKAMRIGDSYENYRCMVPTRHNQFKMKAGGNHA